MSFPQSGFCEPLQIASLAPDRARVDKQARAMPTRLETDGRKTVGQGTALAMISLLRSDGGRDQVCRNLLLGETKLITKYCVQNNHRVLIEYDKSFLLHMFARKQK